MIMYNEEEGKGRAEKMRDWAVIEGKRKKRIEERSHGFYYNEINPRSFDRIERTVAINHDRLKRM